MMGGSLGLPRMVVVGSLGWWRAPGGSEVYWSGEWTSGALCAL